MATENRPGDRQDAPIVQAIDVVRTYRLGASSVFALRGVNLSVTPGTFVALKGRSGSGKTTLLNCIGGLDRPTSGVIEIFGRPLDKMSESELTRWRREHIGFVFQSFALLPTLSAYENVELMPRLAGKGRKACHQQADSCLELVGLTKWKHHRPFEMSGGQQQRVAIARALANHPALMLADEPTGELDSTTAREILGLFRRIVKEQGTTLLMATHDPLVDEYADLIVRLQDGQIVGEE
jgi:ABC-type lipoprotein export system ATPase subunit